MSRFYTTTLRFNLDKPGDRMALQYLQDAGKEEYKSLNRAVIAAVNDHFLRKARLAADPYLETREKEDAFLRRVQETIEQCLQTVPVSTAASTASPVILASDSEEDFETAMDFINSL